MKVILRYLKELGSYLVVKIEKHMLESEIKSELIGFIPKDFLITGKTLT